MASSVVLVDSGPLISLLDRKDAWHEWSTTTAAEFSDSLITCDAVLSETAFMLSKSTTNGVEQLCAMLERGLLRSNFKLEDHLDHVLTVIHKYRDLPASFADACLVAMADADPEARIFTVDAHFKIYRKRNRRVLPLIYPG